MHPLTISVIGYFSSFLFFFVLNNNIVNILVHKAFFFFWSMPNYLKIISLGKRIPKLEDYRYLENYRISKIHLLNK